MPKGVVSDLHGDHQALMGVLRLAGAVDDAGSKQPGWTLISLGDFVHGNGPPRADAPKPVQQAFLNRQARDLACLEKVMSLFDIVCIGNHEFQFLNGPTFDAGDHKCETLVAHSIRDFYQAGALQAATSVGRWLITHAGLQPHYWEGKYDAQNRDAAELAAQLNDDFLAALANPIDLPYHSRPEVFWSMGKRWLGPGRMPPGGIFWADYDELQKGYAELWPDGAPDGALKQIVGHTPQPGPRKMSHYPVVNLDVGAGLSGKACIAVTEDDVNWRSFMYPTLVSPA